MFHFVIVVDGAISMCHIGISVYHIEVGVFSY